MPQNVTLAAFVIGALLLVLALTNGAVKLLGAEASAVSGRLARIIAGSVGILLLGFGVWQSVKPDGPPSGTVSVDNSNTKTSPTPESSPGKCIEQDFADVVPTEAGSGEQPLKEDAGMIRIKLADKHQSVGALRLKYYARGGYFEIVQAVDSNCEAAKDLYNLTRNNYLKDNTLQNDDVLLMTLGGHEYSLGLNARSDGYTGIFMKRDQ